MPLRGCSHKNYVTVMYDHISKRSYLICGTCQTSFMPFKGYTFEALTISEEYELRMSGYNSLPASVSSKMKRLEQS